MTYKWNAAKRIKNCDATAAGELMNELAEQGRLNAKTLVDVSRPADALLHNQFEWDDSKAAEEYRCHQARNIINAIIVIDDSAEGKQTQPVRAFFKIGETANNYMPIYTLLKSPSQTELLLKTALSELSAFRRKYKVLKELADLMEVIDSTMLMYE